ncbi:RNA polymerase II mediator complex subunit [Xylographa opegraphella]|nr:RNA polymerase II mediator complex subunit [Xylographa opegraphella]
MASDLSVSLRVWPTRKTEDQSLSFLITRINGQKGSFRNLTEQSLEQDIRAIEAGELQDSDNEQYLDEKLASTKSRKDEVLVGRDEILKQIGQAQNDSGQALDFISLLLSRHIPKQAEASISPYLKQHLPLGTLGVEIVQSPPKSEAKQTDDERVSTGWKLQSLTATADSLIASATRLGTEMEQEAKHWEEVLSVQKKGWSICRLPRERHNLGVRYGFAEAAAEYRDRGLAALRRNEDGSIFLDLGLQAPVSRRLRVTVKQRGRTTASSSVSMSVENEDPSVEGSIRRARNAIYDEELYHEMYREARSLTNRGIQCMTEGITIPLEEGRSLTVDLAEPSIEENGVVDGASPYSTDRYLARAFSLACKLLLCHAHRQNYNLRTRPLPPLTERKPPRPIYSILRPLLALLQQQSALNDHSDFLQSIHATLKRADLIMTVEPPTGVLGVLGSLHLKTSSDEPLMETLAAATCSPLQAQSRLTLPSMSSVLVVHIRTHLQGIEYKIVLDAPPDSALAQLPQETSFTSAAEMETHLLHLLTLDLVSIVDAENKRWQISSLHECQLSTDASADGRLEVLSISVEKSKLRVSCYATNKDGDVVRSGASWMPATEDQMAFRDVVRTIGAEEVF